MGSDTVFANVEILLLSVLVGITLLGYMIALNAHGPTRLSVSYLIATLILAGTVWAIVQFVNTGLDQHKSEQFERLKREKMQAEQRIRSQEEALLENRQKMEYASQLSNIINEGTGLASTIMNVDLRDFSLELDVLIARANAARAKSKAIVKDFNKVKTEEAFFPQGKAQIQKAIGELSEASKYYWLYFRSEDTAQEELRERVMRQNARKAYEAFQEASNIVAAGR